MDKNTIKEYCKHVWKESEVARYVVGAFLLMKLGAVLIDRFCW